MLSQLDAWSSLLFFVQASSNVACGHLSMRLVCDGDRALLESFHYGIRDGTACLAKVVEVLVGQACDRKVRMVPFASSS